MRTCASMQCAIESVTAAPRTATLVSAPVGPSKATPTKTWRPMGRCPARHASIPRWIDAPISLTSSIVGSSRSRPPGVSGGDATAAVAAGFATDGAFAFAATFVVARAAFAFAVGAFVFGTFAAVFAVGGFVCGTFATGFAAGG